MEATAIREANEALLDRAAFQARLNEHVKALISIAAKRKGRHGMVNHGGELSRCVVNGSALREKLKELIGVLEGKALARTTLGLACQDAVRTLFTHLADALRLHTGVPFVLTVLQCVVCLCVSPLKRTRDGVLSQRREESHVYVCTQAQKMLGIEYTRSLSSLP
jgi:hypothetical protein